jgi:hypothetical protein
VSIVDFDPSCGGSDSVPCSTCKGRPKASAVGTAVCKQRSVRVRCESLGAGYGTEDERTVWGREDHGWSLLWREGEEELGEFKCLRLSTWVSFARGDGNALGRTSPYAARGGSLGRPVGLVL